MPPIREPRTAEARAHRDRIAAVLEAVAQVCDLFAAHRRSVLDEMVTWLAAASFLARAALRMLSICVCVACARTHCLPRPARHGGRASVFDDGGCFVFPRCALIFCVHADVRRAASGSVFARLHGLAQEGRPLVLHRLLCAAVL